MNKLRPKYQLTFPSEEEIRIIYPMNPNIWVGQVSDGILGVSAMMFFLSVVTELVSWNLVYIFLVLSIICVLVRSRFPSNSLKEISLKTDNFKYSYVLGMNNREKHITPPMFIDFCVNIQSDIIEVSFMGIILNLYDTNDLTIFIDKVAVMFDMKYVDTHRLSNSQEVLMYQRKGLSNIIYPTLINIVRQSNGVDFHDMMNQYVWVKFDELHQEIYHYDPTFVLPKLMVLYADIQQVDVILNAGKWVENGKNRIIINLILNNNTKKTVFESTLRNKNQELTSYRDVNIIVSELERLVKLKSIKITKQFNIQ